MVGNPEAVLSSGEKMPLLAMGTANGKNTPDDDLVSTIIQAIHLGYRHFDTAFLYGTERPLGKAVGEAMRRGIIRSRRELFITSKLPWKDTYGHLVVPALKKTLENLELEYLDLYLIHMPVSMKPDGTSIPFSKDLVPMDFKSVWEAMEECQQLGLTKSIGVSNCSSKKLLQLMAHAKIPPAVNQVEMNPTWQQKKLRDFCKKHGIHVSAFSPLGANGAWWGSLAVMESPVLKEIAKAHGKTIAQVSLRWLYEQGVSVVVKSFNKERMKENRQIFDWELTEQDLLQISQIPQKRGFSGELFVSPGGAFKTVEEVWDEEV